MARGAGRKAQAVEDLEVYRLAYEVSLDVYRLTRTFPKDELYGLTSQMRRAAVSVAANLAEGRGRSGSMEFKHFVSIAKGSAEELRCCLRLSTDLGFADGAHAASILEKCATVVRMLTGLFHALSGGASQDAP